VEIEVGERSLWLSEDFRDSGSKIPLWHIKSWRFSSVRG
jgi:hypothetical protein